ncbi:MAG: putative membrane protein YdjX (TVP38/TMEM64 family) [Colwellia polaris]
MQLPHIFKSREKEKKFLKWIFIIAIIFSTSYFLTEPYHYLMYNVEAMRDFIQSFGVFAPLVLIFLQVSQVIVAPIPGPVVGAAAGYAFGVFWGTIYGFIGLAIGSSLAILFAKRYGRPFVEDIVADETMDKFDYLAEEHGFLPFFLLFLLPGFPDDAICFIAGLTDIDTKKLLLMASFGRVPGLLSLTVFGNSLAIGNMSIMILTGAIVILVSAGAWYMRENVVQPGEKIRNPLKAIKKKLYSWKEQA